jgi:hypothetical protein
MSQTYIPPEKENLIRYARSLWRTMVWAHRDQFDEAPTDLATYRRMWRAAKSDARWAYNVLTGQQKEID